MVPTATRLFDIAMALPKAPNCESCIRRLIQAMAERPGVQRVELTPEGDKLIVYYNPDETSGDDLEAAAHIAGDAITHRYRHERLNVTEMDCVECARTVESSVGAMPGVLTSQINFTLGQLEVSYDSEVVQRGQIITRIRELGYDVAESEPTTLRFRLEGLDCAECAEGLAGVVRSVPGVIDAQVNFVGAALTATVEGNDDLVTGITRAVASAGYTARLETGEVAKTPPRRDIGSFFLRQRRGRRTLAAAAAFVLGGVLSLLPVPEALSIAFLALAIVVGGLDVARSAVATLRTTRNLDINVLMTIAVIGAVAIGEWIEAAAVIVLFAVGNTLEAYTLDRARDSLRTLVELTPQEAILIHGDHDERVRVEALQVGDRVRVRPGDRIPADGEVVEGTSAVDESAITGEAIPADKAPGDRVYAGTVNGYGALIARVTESPSDSAIARIVRLVEQAQMQKAPTQRFIDRFSRIYTPVVIAIAVLIAVIPPVLAGADARAWVFRALTLLVIACPCALVISTPVAIVSALGRAAREGVLIKGGSYLEAAGMLNAIAFDKTRTLTEGRPVVTDVIPLNGESESEVLTLAAALERSSEHPLAQAVVREARHRGLAPAPARDFAALPGRGVRGAVDSQVLTIGNRALLGECLAIPREIEEQLLALEQQGKTVFLLGRCGLNGEQIPRELLGVIAVADRVRPESERAIQELRQSGLQHIVMLTGDNQPTAEAIGRQVGVDQVRANLLPDQKVAAVEGLLADYGPVGMVGDGINDAPALARATVGIAMGAAGSDAALETADIALMGDDLTKVPETLRLSRRALNIIRQNVAFALAIKVVFVILAVLGLATLWMAVFADVGTSLLVILNGMRLTRR